MTSTIPRTFVVALDGSELAVRAVTVVSPLARRLGADLLLMTTPWDGDIRTAQAHLESVASATNDVPVDTLVVHDHPAAEAIALVAGAEPDRMICMTTHGRGRFRWAVAGSVAEAVIREARQPLLLVGPHGVGTWSDPPGQVVVCVDGTSAAAGIVATAIVWAHALGSELTLTYVAQPLDIGDALLSDDFMAPLEQDIRDAGIPLHVRVERGSYVAGKLLDVADEPPATMLVMAATGRAGFARVALGSVSMAVVNGAKCPVLITPPHFDAPPAESAGPHVAKAVPTPRPV
jgi:nucleotide-binding universal stress UspA family protein